MKYLTRLLVALAVASLPFCAFAQMPRIPGSYIGWATGVNMASTADQLVFINIGVLNVLPTRMVLKNCSATNSAAVGGLYTASSKGGTAIVSASQTYSTTVGTGVSQSVSISGSTIYTVGPGGTGNWFYFSLSTAGSGTCDIVLFGDDYTAPL